MRRAYLDLHRKEPAIRAVDGKASSIAAAMSASSPRQEPAADVAAAAWVKESVEDTPHGWEGHLNMLGRPSSWASAFRRRRSVYAPTPTGPKWAFATPEPGHHLLLALDAYRNVIGVVNTVRGLRTHDPGKTILFTHSDMFDNPFGQSDLRAAYRPRTSSTTPISCGTSP